MCYLLCKLLILLMINKASWQKTNIGILLQHKINPLVLDESPKFPGIEKPQYDIILSCQKLDLNHTIGTQRIFSARARSTGNVYVLIGNEIHEMSIYHEQIQTIPLARLDDITSDVDDFKIEVLQTTGNKTYIIASLYLEDRFQIYQILLNGYFSNIKSVQKIRRAGQSTNTFLCIHATNLYLITGYIEADIGKVALYRWLDYHFSVEDIKDVNYHSEVVVHNQKQLLILVLQIAEYPERSTNHVFVVNEQRKMIKTQEMYFLFDRLPNYQSSGVLYILRCISLGKCFLYKWNDNLFHRVSKVNLDPRDVNIFGVGQSIAVMIYKGILYFYYKQPLLKAAAPYAVINRLGEVVDTRLYTEYHVSSVYLFENAINGKTYLYITLKDSPKLIEIVQLQFQKHRVSVEIPGEQSHFNTLRSCIDNIKDIVNVRKGWIDLMKYQITNSQFICKKIDKQSLAARYLNVFNTNKINDIYIRGLLNNAPSTLLKQWNNIKRLLYNNKILIQKLFFTNRANDMESNLKIHGNFFTKVATIKNVRVQHTPKQHRRRQKRNYSSFRNFKAVTMRAQEILSKGRLFANLLSRSKINGIISSALLRNLYTPALHCVTNAINQLPLLDALMGKSSDNKKEGTNIFKRAIFKSLNISIINSEHTEESMLYFRNLMSVKVQTTTAILRGLKEVDHVLVRNMLNAIQISELIQQLYYIDSKAVIAGNVLLGTTSYIRNIGSMTVNGYNASQFFDLKSNQTITSSLHISKAYAYVLQSDYVNELSINNGVCITITTKFIKGAVASNFVVLGNLTLAEDDQRLARHVLGTKINDFSQIYNNKVVLKGQLVLNHARFDVSNLRMFVNNLAADFNMRNYFLMKHVKQTVPAFSFRRQIDIHQLLCSDLNYQSLHSYLRRDNWNAHMSMEFSFVHILGNAKIFCSQPNLLFQIYSDAIQRKTLSTVSEQKIFFDIMMVDVLVAESINNITTQSLIVENSVTNIDEAKYFNKIIIEECGINLLGQVMLEMIHKYMFQNIIDDLINIRDSQQILQIVIENIKTELLYASLINHTNAEDFVSEINNFTKTLGTTAKLLRIDHLIAQVNVFSAYQIFIQNINRVNLKEYFALLLFKHTTKHAEVGGIKSFLNGVILNRGAYIELLNYNNVNAFLHHTLKSSFSQNVVGSWKFKNLDSKYITTKKINHVLVKHMVNADILHPEIYQNVSIGNLTVTNIEGNFTPSVLRLLSPKIRMNFSSCIVRNSLILKHYTSNTNVIDLILFGITNISYDIERKVTFEQPLIHLYNIWSNNKIVNEDCHFNSIILDSVKQYQNKTLCFSIGRILANVIVKNLVVFEDRVQQARLLNNINIKSLNNSIHFIGYSSHIEIHAYKIFDSVLGATHLVCNEEISTETFPYNLRQHTFSGNSPQFQYRFIDNLSVIEHLLIEVINEISLPSFLNGRIKLHPTVSHSHEHEPQQLTGMIKFMILTVAAQYNTIHTLNSIQLNDIVVKSSTEHQAVLEVKNIHGTIWMLGPTSAIHCNGLNMLDTYKSCILLRALSLYLGNLTFNELSVLNDGISVLEFINNNPVHITMQLRSLVVEDLLPLIPNIRSQLSTSNVLHHRKKGEKVQMMYVETLIRPTAQRKLVTEHIPGITNTAGTITFGETCVNGIKYTNFSVHASFSNLNWNHNTMSIKGILVRAEWTEVDHDYEKQLIIVLLTTINDKFFLSVYVHHISKIIPRQKIALKSYTSEFELINSKKGFVILLLRELPKLDNVNSTPNLKLFYYDPITMVFVHFKSLNGNYKIIDAVAVLHNHMIVIVEDLSNVLLIYNVDNNNSSLYQKIVFDSTIKVLDVLEIHDIPALRITTQDNIFYIYIHTSLEGWKQHAYAKVTSDSS